MSVTHGLRKTANALSSEGDLRNVHDELKDVARSMESRVKANESATKAIITWTERRREDPSVREFLTAMGDLDAERCMADRRYIDQFKLFVRLWKDVLAEKKELNSKVSTLKKARSALESARKKFQKIEMKEPREQDKYNKAKRAMDDAEAAEGEAKRAVDIKLLEVQQDKHQSLRSGYANLYTANLGRLKDLSMIEEKVRTLVNTFPEVVSRNDDGTFVLGKYEGRKVKRAAWCQGEELGATLDKVNETHQQKIAKLNEAHKAAMQQLIHEQNKKSNVTSENYSSELQAVIARSESALHALEEDHKASIAAADERRRLLEEAHQKHMAGAKEQYSLLEAELEKRNAQIRTQIADEAKLENEMECLQRAVVQDSFREAKRALSLVNQCLPRPCSDSVLDHARECQSALSKIKIVFEQRGMAPSHVHNAVHGFANAVSNLLLSSYGACRGSKAENSIEMIGLAQALEKSAQTLLDITPACLRGTNEEEDDDEEVDKEVDLYEALYPHDAKAHDGFQLVGFAKGDVMELLKHRSDGWSKVSVNGVQGWAPTSYIQKADPSAKETTQGTSDGSQECAEVNARIEAMVTFLHAMVKRDKEISQLANTLADSIGSKVSAAQQSIMDALQTIEKLREDTKASDHGRQLEVNQDLLGLSQRMLEEMRALIEASIVMKQALKDSQGVASMDEFNEKHKNWFEGLTSAVDTVTEGNPMLTEALRCVIGRKGKHEEMQVAVRNVAASVARLAALSRTKTLTQEDGAQENLESHSQALISTSHEVLASVRESQQIGLASILMEDFNDLSENEAKRLVMATQVNVLKLESELTKEREKLGRLRRLNYVSDNASEKSDK